jgi:ABC-type phosphate transport system substrate-binding protein
VRFDVSGTTLQFKRWLDQVNPGRGWTGFANSEWPGATINPGTKGGGALAALVKSTDGSLGYVDLATARANGFETAGGGTDDTFWLAVDDNAGQPSEPTADPDGYREGTPARGANCDGTQFTRQPGGADPTLEDWSQVTGATTPSGYPLCLLTFDLAWDDQADVYGSGDGEQGQARTVKDYLADVVGTSGQSLLPAGDYSSLPRDIQAVSLRAVESIDWNKSGG